MTGAVAHYTDGRKRSPISREPVLVCEGRPPTALLRRHQESRGSSAFAEDDVGLYHARAGSAALTFLDRIRVVPAPWPASAWPASVAAVRK